MDEQVGGDQLSDRAIRSARRAVERDTDGRRDSGDMVEVAGVELAD